MKWLGVDVMRVCVREDTHQSPRSNDSVQVRSTLALFGSSEAVFSRFKRSGDNILGLDERGKEVIRVPTREPLRVLPGWDPKYGVVRSNCP